MKPHPSYSVARIFGSGRGSVERLEFPGCAAAFTYIDETAADGETNAAIAVDERGVVAHFRRFTGTYTPTDIGRRAGIWIA